MNHMAHIDLVIPEIFFWHSAVGGGRKLKPDRAPTVLIEAEPRDLRFYVGGVQVRILPPRPCRCAGRTKR
jgi:hypothetical protein